MTKSEAFALAYEWQNQGGDPDSTEELSEVFEALFGRKATASDGDQTALVGHIFNACKTEYELLIERLIEEIHDRDLSNPEVESDGELAVAIEDATEWLALLTSLQTARDALGAVLDAGGDGTWIASDESQQEVEYDACTAEEAAKKYADDGEWYEDGNSTSWIQVTVKAKWLPDREPKTIDVRLDPEVPPCEEGHEHDWQSPHAKVGGMKENPGVFGHGGGIVSNECCVNCGCLKKTDTWVEYPPGSQNFRTGISYEPGYYAEERQ